MSQNKIHRAADVSYLTMIGNFFIYKQLYQFGFGCRELPCASKARKLGTGSRHSELGRFGFEILGTNLNQFPEKQRWYCGGVSCHIMQGCAQRRMKYALFFRKGHKAYSKKIMPCDEQIKGNEEGPPDPLLPTYLHPVFQRANKLHLLWKSFSQINYSAHWIASDM